MVPTNMYKENKPRNPFSRLTRGSSIVTPGHRLVLIMVFCMGCAIGFVSWLQSQFLIIAPTSSPAPLQGHLVTQQEWQDFSQDYKSRFAGRDPPKGMDAWLAYAMTYQCNERDFYQGMDEDLSFFRDVIQKEGKKFRQAEITPAGLDQTDNYMGFKLKNHILRVTASRNFGNNNQQQREIEQLLRWILEPARVHEPAIDATYFFNLHDGATPAKDTTKRPVFSVCKQTYWTENKQPPAILHFESVSERKSHSAWQHDNLAHHPDYQDWAAFESRDLMVPYHFGYDSASAVPDNPNAKAFDQRKDSIIWRGSTTGSVWGESPRFRLIAQYGGTTGEAYQLSKDVPVMVDMGFVDILQNGPGQTLAPKSRRANRLEYQDLQENKYIMDVDGNAFTARFPGLLKSGSAIFKSTRYREWYTERLRPYVDYIPVNYNLTDLPQKLKWAHEHPTETAKITQHANQIATKFLRREDMRCYMYRLLLEYQTLFED